MVQENPFHRSDIAPVANESLAAHPRAYMVSDVGGGQAKPGPLKIDQRCLERCRFR